MPELIGAPKLAQGEQGAQLQAVGGQVAGTAGFSVDDAQNADGVLTGAHYNVNLISNSIENSRVDGANVTTLEVMMNVVSLASGANSQIQTVLDVTQNANGEITTQFQNFHVHCQSD